MTFYILSSDNSYPSNQRWNRLTIKETITLAVSENVLEFQKGNSPLNIKSTSPEVSISMFKPVRVLFFMSSMNETKQQLDKN